MDKEDSNDDKVLKALKSVCKKTKGPQKEVLEYQISQMNQRKILRKNLNIFQSRVSKERLNAKIGREQNYKAGLEKLLLIDESNLSELQKKRDFSEKKLYFLERAKKKAFDQNEDTRYVKTTGNLKLTITDVQINPVFKCSRIDFIVDMNIKKSLKPAFRGDVNISLINSKEFEIIVIGEEDSIISLIFFPCEYLVSHTQSKEEFLDIEEGFIKLKVSFEKEAKLVRRNAERSCVILFGHTLESYRCIYLLYCCVCSQSINYFTPAFRCLKCKFTCHKICANYIFFKCPCVEHEKESVTKRYDIPHKLVNKTSSGVIWCSHCGERIDFNTSCSQCIACGIKLHEVCSKRVFNACGITYELRCAIADFNPPVNDNLRLKSSANIDDFTFLKVLGRGSFGKVMLAKHLHNNQIVALKILKKESLVDSNEITCIELERRVLDFATKSNHPFLMKMHFCFQDSMHLFFGTEFLPGGDLFHHAAKNDFSNSQIKLYAAEILMGIEFLHRSNIIYRDMKLDNILLAADGHVKIADFGLCRDKFGPYTVAYTYCGTPDTIAPEVILNGGYTKDTDWWSYGVVLYEMFEGEPPFNGATALEMSAGIIHDEVQFKKTPEVAQDLISKLLTKDPSQRLGHGMEDGEEIRSHPYFSKIDWNDVLERKYKPVFIPGDSINANFDEEFIEEPIHLTPCNSVVQYDKYFTNFK